MNWLLFLVPLIFSMNIFAYTVSEKELNQRLQESLKSNPDQDLSDLLKSARAVPHGSKSGEVKGFKDVKIKKGSTFEKLSLKKGDVIKSINVRPVTNPREAMKLYSELEEGSEVQVQRKDSK